MAGSLFLLLSAFSTLRNSSFLPDFQQTKQEKIENRHGNQTQGKPDNHSTCHHFNKLQKSPISGVSENFFENTRTRWQNLRLLRLARRQRPAEVERLCNGNALDGQKFGVVPHNIVIAVKTKIAKGAAIFSSGGPFVF